MGNGELLQVEPQELQFPFQVRKQISCSLLLMNKRDQNVAFKVKTTNPNKYSVRPNTGIVLPRSTSTVIVTMQAHKEPPPDFQCSDKFLVQSVVTNHVASAKDLPADMFYKEEGRYVEEIKLKVSYTTHLKPPSPVRQGSEQGTSPRPSVSENNNLSTTPFTTFGKLLAESQISRSNGQPQDNSSEVKALIAKLTQEKSSIMQQRNKLLQELEVLKRASNTNRGGGVPFLYVIIICILGMVLGYFLKRT